ncbi:hypothetical protein Rs2_15965 [Raphanus sativus]|nr:hypothetical protein Rs2_15965 [Raphanus sativus]
MASQGIETHQATALNEMNKQIEDICLSQIQQTKEICKELGGQTAELKAMMEKFFSFNTPPAKQAEGTTGITAAGSHQQTDPPDLSPEKKLNNNNSNQSRPPHG